MNETELTRRAFLEALAVAESSGFALDNKHTLAATSGHNFYDVPRFGNVSLPYLSDSHEQLLPYYFLEPDTNIGAGEAFGEPPHLTGDALLKHFGIASGTRHAHAFTHHDFEQAARTYGKVGVDIMTGHWEFTQGAGTRLLPGQYITVEDVMNHTAFICPQVVFNEVANETIKNISKTFVTICLPRILICNRAGIW